MSEVGKTDAPTKPAPDTSQFVNDFYTLQATVAKMAETVNALSAFGPALAAVQEKLEAATEEMQRKANSADLAKLSDSVDASVADLGAKVAAIPAGPKGDKGDPGPAAPFGGDAATLLEAAKNLRDQIQGSIDGTGATAEFARAFVPFVNALIAHMPLTE